MQNTYTQTPYSREHDLLIAIDYWLTQRSTFEPKPRQLVFFPGIFNQEVSGFSPSPLKTLLSISQEAMFSWQWKVVCRKYRSTTYTHRHTARHKHACTQTRKLRWKLLRLIHGIEDKGYCGSQRTSYIHVPLLSTGWPLSFIFTFNS